MRNQRLSDNTPISHVYSSGKYYDLKSNLHKKDAEFKAEHFVRLFVRNASLYKYSIQSYIDVGCGTGDILKKISALLIEKGHALKVVKGYDVAPQVAKLSEPGMEFICGDFCKSNEDVNLVTLFDVIEHVPDPIRFLRDVSDRAEFIGINIPLENNLNFSIRDKYRDRIKDPGHIMFMDIVGVLNLHCLAGLRVIDYQYINNFLAPTGHLSLLSKMVLPVRYTLTKINPWFLSCTLGGLSLMVLSITPRGIEKGWAI